MLAQTGLHRTFASLSDDKDDILRFLQRFAPAESVDALGVWQNEIGKMDEAVHVWTSLHLRDQEIQLNTLAGLKYLIDAHLKDRVSLVMVPRKDDVGLDFTYVPKDFITALWLQFAHEVSEGKKYRCCAKPSCGVWFELSPSIARKSRLFCSDACKSRDYREKQDKARQLYVKKKSFKEIAEELGSDISAIKRWIQGK